MCYDTQYFSMDCFITYVGIFGLTLLLGFELVKPWACAAQEDQTEGERQRETERHRERERETSTMRRLPLVLSLFLFFRFVRRFCTRTKLNGADRLFYFVFRLVVGSPGGCFGSPGDDFLSNSRGMQLQSQYILRWVGTKPQLGPPKPHRGQTELKASTTQTNI